MEIEIEGDAMVIDKRYWMYPDGVVYDNLHGGDIPQWIFEFRDFVLNNCENMKCCDDCNGKMKHKAGYGMYCPECWGDIEPIK